MPNFVSFGASYISGCSFVFDSISSGCSFVLANIEHAQEVLGMRDVCKPSTEAQKLVVTARSAVSRADPERTSVLEG